jgi:hypothetical protein
MRNVLQQSQLYKSHTYVGHNSRVEDREHGMHTMSSCPPKNHAPSAASTRALNKHRVTGTHGIYSAAWALSGC